MRQTTMSTRPNNPRPNQGRRDQKALPSGQQRVMDYAATPGRVVVVETVPGEDVIRVSIETARAAAAPEQIIVF